MKTDYQQFHYETLESLKMAFYQIRANKIRSFLTALGVIIGIVAITMMGTAINGIDLGFEKKPCHARLRCYLCPKIIMEHDGPMVEVSKSPGP